MKGLYAFVVPIMNHSHTYGGSARDGRTYDLDMGELYFLTRHGRQLYATLVSVRSKSRRRT